MKRPIRTAIVGFGVSGSVFHAPLIEADPNYSLDAIVTANSTRAAQAAQRYPNARIFSSADQLFDETASFDLVVLGTPPDTHVRLATAAISHGLNLVIDKPFVPASEDGERLLRLSDEAAVQLTVFQNRRWDADFLTLQKIVYEGRLGEVRSFESRFEWWRPEGFGNWRDSATPAQGGGLLHDLGAHLIDQAICLFGPVTETYGEVANHGPNPSGGESEAFVSLLHKSGVRSRLWMNGTAALRGPRFHLLGSTGAYIKWELDSQEPDLASGMLPTDPNYGVEPTSSWGLLGTEDDQEKVPAEKGYYPAFYQQLSHSLAGKGPVPVDPRDSLEVLRTIEAIHDSVQHTKTISG